MATFAASFSAPVATVSSKTHSVNGRSTKPAAPRSGFRAAIAPGFRLKAPSQTLVAHRQKALVVKAVDPAVLYDLPAYPNPDWIEACAEEFPEYGMASIEQARTLFAPEIGYKYLDVRASYELDSIGKVPGSINIPLINGKPQWNSETGTRDFVQSVNAEFLNQIQKTFPDKSTKIIVGCSDGFNRTIQACMLMEEAGYTHIVAIQGGFNLWTRKFDNKLRRRRSDGYTERYDSGARGSDSAGIHASGAGFEKMDAIDQVQGKDPTEWFDWKTGKPKTD